MHIFPAQFKNTAIVVASVILAFMFFGCATFNNHYGDEWFGKDKFYHFTAAGVIGAGTTAVAKNNGSSECDAPVIGISVGVGFGAGKEFYDLSVKETYWSWKDMLWDLIGCSVGSYAVSKCD